MEISFSIVMPNYNSAYLKRAISSVINQTYTKWELIIIDDFSSNNPENIIKEFRILKKFVRHIEGILAPDGTKPNKPNKLPIFFLPTNSPQICPFVGK